MVSIEEVRYQNWLDGLRLANERADLVVTTQVGPRVIRFGFVDADNEFAELPDVAMPAYDDTWRMYGGHRFWHAPEVAPRTYHPDNEPVTWQQRDDGVRVTQPVEKHNGIQKELDIWLAPDAAHTRITHRLTNRGVWPVELAPWAISVMAPGGAGVIPLPPRGAHGVENLLPTSTLSLWPYTDMSDPRWTWGHRYLLLRQDPTSPGPQKIGAYVPDGWVAYARRGHLFVKQVTPVAGAVYPDSNSMVELYSDPAFQEVETFGPLVRLAPGASVEHVEEWHLLRDVHQPAGEQDVIAEVVPQVAALPKPLSISTTVSEP
ncbi:MAG: hypothetical protein DCC55_08205 [Chloroflexi bacterium]|nr:MAG: hypothetical protein DCC55_08205 [Chloroflexota bacterium]